MLSKLPAAPDKMTFVSKLSDGHDGNAPINGIPHSPTPGLDGEIVGI